MGSLVPQRSPWIEQLQRQRPVQALTQNEQADIAIVGGGIAGLMTAYFILTTTDRQVTLIEGGKVAHGATGHNAGQLVSYFERQISSLVEECGITLAAEAQRSIDAGWTLLEEIFQRVPLKTQLWSFTGYAGLSTTDEILIHLKNSAYSAQANITIEKMLIAESWLSEHPIPAGYEKFYTITPHSDILQRLETNNPAYIAAICGRKGCMNSASFTEEIAEHLTATYPERFRLYEDSSMHELVLQSDTAQLKILQYVLTAQRVVLCTNGFERFKITNTAGPDVDTKFHQLVQGAVGYMAAFTSSKHRRPTAISYLPPNSETGNAAFDSEPYFYLTRRPFIGPEGAQGDLICVGGPDTPLSDTNAYTRQHPYPSEAQKVIEEFLRTTYLHTPATDFTYSHLWHGLMGYTPNGVRCVGAEPLNPVLLYNLGCNGVGILPSIFGGQRIAQLIDGQVLPKTIFDPRQSV